MWDRLITQQGIGGEAIIWLIIAFFWVVAQLATRAKERARARELDRQQPDQSDETKQERDPPTFEREMRRFLENVGAEPAEEDELFPEQQTEPLPRPRIRRRPAPAQPTPPPLHLVERQRPEPATDPIDTRLGDIDPSIDESVLDTSQAYAVRESTRAETINAFVNPRTLLVNLNYLRMNMPLIPISGLDTTHEARPRPELHGRENLRSAVTTQLILSNPLAMGEDKASFTKRMV